MQTNPTPTRAKETPDEIKLAMAKTNDLFNTGVFAKKNYDALDRIYTADANATSAVLESIEVMPIRWNRERR